MSTMWLTNSDAIGVHGATEGGVPGHTVFPQDTRSNISDTT